MLTSGQDKSLVDPWCKAWWNRHHHGVHVASELRGTTGEAAAVDWGDALEDLRQRWAHLAQTPVSPLDWQTAQEQVLQDWRQARLRPLLARWSAGSESKMAALAPWRLEAQRWDQALDVQAVQAEFARFHSTMTARTRGAVEPDSNEAWEVWETGGPEPAIMRAFHMNAWSRPALPPSGRTVLAEKMARTLTDVCETLGISPQQWGEIVPHTVFVRPGAPVPIVGPGVWVVQGDSSVMDAVRTFVEGMDHRTVQRYAQHLAEQGVALDPACTATQWLSKTRLAERQAWGLPDALQRSLALLERVREESVEQEQDRRLMKKSPALIDFDVPVPRHAGVPVSRLTESMVQSLIHKKQAWWWNAWRDMNLAAPVLDERASLYQSIVETLPTLAPHQTAVQRSVSRP